MTSYLDIYNVTSDMIIIHETEDKVAHTCREDMILSGNNDIRYVSLYIRGNDI